MSQAEQREEAVFEAALQLPASERTAYLDQTCASDADLRRRVDVLLGAFERAGGFMKQPAVATPTRPLVLPPTEKPGDIIGRYKLLEQIGEGGCGVVYVAEQEEPVRRRVALKVIKLGMDTKQVIARFDAERQALALMDHPNIAKIHDAGVTDTGRPYFIMELVRGIKITDYCDQNRLSPRERLDLFAPVCRAIQHAHQKGIIHRDIKPSNILVTLHDGVPVPKVIDFGIAKATQGRLTDQTVHTALEQFIGTPAYMSPEQAEMSGLDIDTRSDIYSLGVLLYELLTGKTPFDAKKLWAAGLDEMRRTIREVEPVKPSTRLGQERLENRSATSGKSEIRNLKSAIAADLDWIVMKCLEKDRTRRYETASGLATDISRHLNNEPVVARPPSQLYRFQKSVQRNKLAFGAATAVALALVIGLVVSTAMYFKAEAEKEKAQTEAAKSQQVAQFLKDMLKGVGPSVALGRNTEMLREILDKTSERLSHDLTNQPMVEAELRDGIGRVYWELGEFNEAEAMQRRALELRWKTLGSNHIETARTMSRLSGILENLAKYAEAEKLARQALAIQTNLIATDHPDIAYSFNSLGVQLASQGKIAEATEVYKRALGMRERLFGRINSEVAITLGNLAGLSMESNPAEAEKGFREVIGIVESLHGKSHPELETPLDNLAGTLVAQKRSVEAEAVLWRALTLQTNLLGKYHPHNARSLWILLGVLKEQGKFIDAEQVARGLVELYEKMYGRAAQATLLPCQELHSILVKEGKQAETRAFAEDLVVRAKEALETQRRLGTNDLSAFIKTLSDIAAVMETTGNYSEAVSLVQQRLVLERRLNGKDDAKIASTLDWMARLYFKDKKRAEEELALSERLAIKEKEFGPEHTNLLSTLDRLVSSLESQNKTNDLALHLHKVWRIRANAFGEANAETMRTHAKLVSVLVKEKRLAEAATMLSARLESNPTNAAVLRARGELFGRAGRWKEAAADFSRSIQLNPTNVIPYRFLAPLLIANGKIAAYRELCRQMLARFGETQQPDVADNTAKACLLLPSSGVDSNAVAKLAEVAVTLGQKSEYLRWFQLCKALSDYRQGNFTAAIDWANKALGSSIRLLERDAAACVVLAMAQRQLKEDDAARVALDRAKAIVNEKLPKLDARDLGVQWIDRIIVDILLSEAQALIESKVGTAAEEKPEFP